MYNQGINVPINLNLITVERLHNSHLRDRRKWPFMGRWGGGGEGGNTTPAVLFFLEGGGWSTTCLFFQVHAYCSLHWQSNPK